MLPSKEEMAQTVCNYCQGRNCEECCLGEVVVSDSRCWQDPIDLATLQSNYLQVKSAQQKEMEKILMYNDFKLQANLEPPEDDRPIKHLCDSCGEPIREGDDYYYINDEYYCDRCVENGRRYG